jgi:aminopeptidase
MSGYQEIARGIVRICARVREDEAILIVGRQDNLHFCELIAFECSKVGASPIVSVESDSYVHRLLSETPIEFLKKTAKHMLALIRSCDVIITVGMERKDPAVFSDLPEERLAAYRMGRKPWIDVVYDGQRRLVGTDFPTKEQAAAYGLEFRAFHDVYWRAMAVDYKALMRRASKVAQTLRKAGEVHITSAKGTDVVVGFQGRTIHIEDGVIDEADVAAGHPFANLPAGEVYVAPLEDRSDGRVIFDLAFHRGNKIEDLEVEFHAGTIRPIKAACGLEVFCEVLENSQGDKDKIGELGIGLNPEIEKVIGFALLDEKIMGTVHLAIGDNRFMGGVNDSDLHWDLVIQSPTVVAAETLLIEDGSLRV